MDTKKYMDITVVLPYIAQDKYPCALQYKCFSQFFTNIQVVTCPKTLVTHEHLCTKTSMRNILYIYSPYVLPFKPPPQHNIQGSLVDDSVRLVHYHCPKSRTITSVPYLCTQFAPTMNFSENTHFVYFSPNDVMTMQNMYAFTQNHLRVQKIDRQIWADAHFLWQYHSNIIFITIVSFYICYRLCKILQKKVSNKK